MICNNMRNEELIEELIDLAIEEDISTGDISTDAIIPVNSMATAVMTAKADGVVSGLSVIRKVYERFEDGFEWEPYVNDGDHVRKGDRILRIKASYRTLLYGERLSLNILQRMSGIATATARYVEEIKDTHTVILDTRKTAPGMRILDKMAVHDGGGKNHRMGLYDMVMLKVFDNMDNATMAEAVKLIGGKAKTEASGNMSIPRLKEVAATGVDYISVGALTHSVTALDISMNITQD